MRRYALAVLLSACSASVDLPAPVVSRALCALDAVKGLPTDPDMVTLGQAREAARALKACDGADAGVSR